MPADPVIVRPGEGPVHSTPFGDTLRWLAGEAKTGLGYSIHDRIAPLGSRSTPHVHHHVSEAFYVIDGELELQVGDEKVAGTAGTFVLAPPNVTHAWRNDGDRDAHVLVLFSPPVALGYFEELDRLTKSGEARSNPAVLTALAARYGLD